MEGKCTKRYPQGEKESSRLRSYLAPALVAAALAAAPSVARADVPVGKAPPSLGNFDVAQGDPFTDLKDLKGHVVRLVFFATW